MRPAYLQITRECNNECVFCSNPQFISTLSANQILGRIDDFWRSGFDMIILTGGEPTLVDLQPVLRQIRKRKMGVKMITNGVLLSDMALVRSLKKEGLDDINISLHSCKENIQDKLSGKKGHFQKTIQGISNSIKAKMHVMINSTINTLNHDHLSYNARYLTDRFPEVRHYVFNGLDPGMADGKIQSRAGMNRWIVPRLTDFEIELSKTAAHLRHKGKTFRVERVPLCYMRGFEDFSTETRKIVKNEEYVCAFIETHGMNVRKVSPTMFREKVKQCKNCMLESICAGVQKEYLDMYGKKELYPVFQDPLEIIRRIA